MDKYSEGGRFAPNRYKSETTVVHPKSSNTGLILGLLFIILVVSVLCINANPGIVANIIAVLTKVLENLQ